ncbi:MAG TPA: type II toxin-antitoxin system Phd/YefM family antitoxin [bacterium]|nr:type II toxin-antitoxin system Phd/YefM family antitoxin [bacterium]HPN45254.1 type II toxin-antitoxin system Phd/YefM family antitoxin [bacterium]
MSSIKISVSDATRKLPAIVDRVANKSEQFLLIRGKNPIARLVPVIKTKNLRELPDIIAHLPKLSEEVLAGFEQDILRVRKSA